MKLPGTNRNKIILLLLISIVIFVLWEVGLEQVYLRSITGITNAFLHLVKDETHIELIRENGEFHFEVYSLFTNPQNHDGAKLKGHFPQEIKSLMQPFVIIISWQIFLFIIFKPRNAIRSLFINIPVYLALQVFFLVTLTGYYSSLTASFIFNMMLDSFYIIALILIMKDYMLYGLNNR